MVERKIFLAVLFTLSVTAGFFFGYNKSKPFQYEVAKKLNQIAVKHVEEKRPPVKVPIAIYHSVRPHIKGESKEQDRYDITPELLMKQLQYLKANGYTTISFDTLADYFDTGKTLPVKPVILSFDDSWRNQYQNAFPLLVQEKMSATFFVFTNSLNRKNHLTWNETREMKAAGMEIGSHTKFHPYLDQVASVALLDNEVIGSKKILEESIGTTTAFAYPFGEHSTSSVNEVKRAGYRVARTILGGNMQSEGEKYTLRGFIVSDDLAEFIRTIEK